MKPPKCFLWISVTLSLKCWLPLRWGLLAPACGDSSPAVWPQLLHQHVFCIVRSTEMFPIRSCTVIRSHILCVLFSFVLLTCYATILRCLCYLMNIPLIFVFLPKCVHTSHKYETGATHKDILSHTFLLCAVNRWLLKASCWSRRRRSRCDLKMWTGCFRTVQRTLWSGSPKVVLLFVVKGPGAGSRLSTDSMAVVCNYEMPLIKL